jgi:HK97 family phage major capsid protein
MPQLNRTVKIQKRAAQDGVIELAISSEAPYERWFGIEILSHAPGAVDLTRLGDNRHPLLLNHCMDDQIGVIQDPVVGDDLVLRANAKFSKSDLAQEILQDVGDGIRTLVSVGYMIDEIEEIEPTADPADLLPGGGMRTVRTGCSGDIKVLRTLSGDEFEREMRTQHGDNWQRAGLAAKRDAGESLPTFLVTRWTPFEASIVPVPADVTVGVGRSAGADATSQTVAQAAQEPTPSIIITEHRNMTAITEKSPEALELERRDAIAALGEQYGKYLKPNDVKDAMQGKISRDAFVEIIMARMVSAHSDTSGAQIGLTNAEVKRYSFGKALIAQVTGDWRQAGFEKECSEAVATMMGRSPEGFFLPPDMFKRDFNVGTGSEAGNLVATQLRGDLFTDVLRANMVMSSLGVTYLSGLSSNVDLPRKTVASTLGMLTEIGSASETNPNTAKATLTPHRIGAYVQVSKQALLQSGIALENMIRNDLVVGAAVLLENQVINGAGTAAEIKGLRNVTGIGTTTAGTNGASPLWADVVNLESACANANAEPDRVSGYLVNTKVRGKLKQTQFATNLPFIWQNGPQPLNGYAAAVTNNVPSNLTKGTSTTICSASLFGSDWSNVTIGLFGAPDVTVDPYSLAATGQVQITLNQFADMQHRQPATTAKIEDWLTT